jgi:uncharacterized 2Fe-2S/4Fe-4S cluster protein (DUF4445 family)
VKKYKATFYPDNREVVVDQGENLLRAALAAEVHVNASCGGDGTCGKCRVVVDKGLVTTKGSPKLSGEEKKEGYVLACLSQVQSDVEVRVPPESRLGRVPRERERVKACGHIFPADTTERLRLVRLEPPAKKVFLELSPPTLDDSASDTQRVARGLRSSGFREEKIELDAPVLKYLASLLREADFKITATLLEDDRGIRITKIEKGDTAENHYAIAVDVGTTTVVARLVDLGSKEALAERSDYNSQVSCGEDVISRIVFASKKGGLDKLQNLAIKTINNLTKKLIEETGVDPEDISAVYIAGNTIMLHLLLGLNPKYIREEPYIPTVSIFPWIRARDLGIDLPDYTYVYPLPCVASYLGADVVAGIAATGISRKKKLALYIDIGTNGEIVLGGEDWLISCSCSAGPAFEGGGVKHGTRATAGAIEQVRIDAETCEPMILTIGGRKPMGICGSGLIDTLAELFLSRIINQRGKFDLTLSTPRVRKGESGAEYVLVWEDESGTKKDIVITEVDIDNLLRAKAAIFAGISILLDSVAVSLGDIEEIYIAGAFGKYLEVEKAVTIGLLPDLDCDKFIFIGNGSLWGAHMVALSREGRDEVRRVARRMTYLDLSTNPRFMDGYVSALFLPHTNAELFPSVMAQMANSR